MKRTTLALALLALAPAAADAQAPAPAAKPTIPQICQSCHQARPDAVQGIYENVAFKSRAIQLKIDAHTEIVPFDPAVLQVVDGGVVKPAEALRDLPKNREARIDYTMKDGAKLATRISFKGPIKIAPEKLATYDEVVAMVAAGPQKGNYMLVDSRPLPRVQEGTIPTSVNIPYPAWDKVVGRLPQDKSQRVVFFCQGVTCMMSPNSLMKAEALGYTNAKVYREGYPEWLERNIGVIAAAHYKEAFVDKQIPAVLVDARPSAIASQGFIAGAVSIPPSKAWEAVPGLPPAKLKAPIVVYDDDGGKSALVVAQVIKASGQPNVTVLGGGVDAWVAARNPVASGTLPTKIAYAPKPRPGSIPNAEFEKIAKSTPTEVLILDVRNADEAKGGMIKGAMLIPDEELAARIAEVPKDKKIVTHCSTGIRAEMAYHKLKDAGYNAAFVYAQLDIDKSGNVKLTAN
ncbi:MAG: rhodanese-like domain-containing protein [Burkholderiales bacterium]